MFCYGKNFRIQLFGQSHSEEMGVVIEGIPAGTALCTKSIQALLDRRAPGKNAASTQRKESDVPRVISGLVNGVTTGTPLCAVFANTDTKSADYAKLADLPRPSHSDYPAFVKFGDAHDLRGGGSFSGRMTAPLCFAGGVALQLLAQRQISVFCRVLQVGTARDCDLDYCSPDLTALNRLKQQPFPVLNAEVLQQMLQQVEQARLEGDSVGGILECVITGLPAGAGSHMFDGLENRIAAAVFGVPGVKGLEFGDAFAGAQLRGSAYNDAFAVQNGKIVTQTNHCGGILGGMSDGMPLYFRAAVKPTPSIAKPQQSVNLRTLQPQTLQITGRHDPCIAFRAAPAVEAAAAIAVLDVLSES